MHMHRNTEEVADKRPASQVASLPSDAQAMSEPAAALDSEHGDTLPSPTYPVLVAVVIVDTTCS